MKTRNPLSFRRSAVRFVLAIIGAICFVGLDSSSGMAAPPPPLAGLEAGVVLPVDPRTTGGTASDALWERLVVGFWAKAPAIVRQKSPAFVPASADTELQPDSSSEAAQAAPTAGKANLTVVNQAGVAICYLYISPSDADTWGEDWLGDAVIRPGKQRTFSLPPGEYDLKAEDCEGNILSEHHNVDISGKMRWTVEGVAEEAQEAEESMAEPETPSDGAEETYAEEGAPDETVALTQFLCCGYTIGGTRVWGIGYPEGWRVQYLPNNDPNDFVGALFSNPSGNMQVLFVPTAWTPMGTPLDTGDVDAYLDAYTVQRTQKDPDFTEFLRQPLPGLPMYRVWAGTWTHDGKQFWESYLVGVNPMPYVEGMPRGSLSAMGVRADSAHWQQVKRIYAAMLETMRVAVIRSSGYTPPSPSSPPDSEAEGMAEQGSAATSFWELVFCPRACRWEYIDVANQPAGQLWCCSDGCIGELSEVPCVESACRAQCVE